ncbi:MAG: PLP-dependent aminotransferase family protein [Clostridia bacterium]|nr:PLP-dependent aminotransferase family protein [Clostridia bacterium]
MLDLNLDLKNKYYSLYSQIRGKILSGKIKAGEKLPSKRALAEELGVSVTTVQLAYEQLLAEGYICSRERSGYFAERVNSPEPPPRNQSVRSESAQKEKFFCDMVKGNTPAHMFPFSTWARLMRLVLADCGEHLLERVPCGGDPELKQAISDYLYRSRGLDVDPRHIIIGAGAEHLYDVVIKLLGRDKIFAVENPSYGKISSSYALGGAKWVAVNVGEKGIDVTQLANSGAHAVHISPAHQFPTGAVTPVSVRLKITEWANSVGGYVIEDDYDSEFRLSGKPLQNMFGLCPSRVIYMNTFSKTLAPSMRLGYMVLPPELYNRYITLFSSSANIVPLFEQKALAAMLNGGYFERLLSRLKNYYRGIRKTLLEKLFAFGGDCEVSDSGSGLHIIVKFPRAQSDAQIKERAAELGVNLKCVSDYLIAPRTGLEKRAVINYSGLTAEILEKL